MTAMRWLQGPDIETPLGRTQTVFYKETNHDTHYFLLFLFWLTSLLLLLFLWQLVFILILVAHTLINST